MNWKSYVSKVGLFSISQIPMVILLWFFYVMDLSLVQKLVATIIILFEAVLMSELIGQTIQPFYSRKENLVFRGILQRINIPWSEVDELRQIALSPMKKNSEQIAMKFYAVKTKHDVKLPKLSDWWEKHSSSPQTKPVERYNSFVKGSIEDYYVLWAIDTKHDQKSDDDAQLCLVNIDPREEHIIKELHDLEIAPTKHLREIIDLTYPNWYLEVVDKSAEDVWSSITSKQSEHII